MKKKVLSKLRTLNTNNMRDLVLALNPRMYFTRVAVYQGNSTLFLKKINHHDLETEMYPSFEDQVDFRTSVILKELKENDVEVKNIKVIIGRGGLLKPVESGVYRVNSKMIKDLSSSEFGDDVVNLGGLLANGIAKAIDGAHAYIADPVVVDELQDIARFTGRPEFKRRSIFHALNQKISARKYAKIKYSEYEKMNLIVVHLGGGISIGAHKKGRVIDTNQAYDGDGPFSPIRSGSLPMGDVIRMCYSGKFTMDEMLKKQTGDGGLYSYFKTHSAFDVCQLRDAGDEKAAEVLSAMAYQVSKYISSLHVCFDGEKLDGIIITGGLAKDDTFVSEIRNRVEIIAPVYVMPGAEVLGALSYYGQMILRGETDIKDYD
ncbi:butyrate kinase [Ancylomarina subtilis]|uniref:Probable butyrate kinase n=1 Tax=Ancylomarina subtilis TaxID=1639035 RepID=A0A4Q7VJ50_9BACT|nr:butyrate kinase [Ancylomarina subtilis]RZT96087.1 butyrate kinase [Ancylomarina subtilis]